MTEAELRARLRQEKAEAKKVDLDELVEKVAGEDRRDPYKELSPLGPLAGCFLALGSGLGLVGTVSARR